MNGPLKFSSQPDFDHPVLIVSWMVDSAGLGEKVTDYLNKKLNNRSFGEIDPAEFFPLEGVTIEDDVIQFPESKFYSGSRKDVVILQSTPPFFDWYRFLNLVLDVAQEQCHAREIYAIGGMASLAAHTAPREMLGNFNSAEMKEALVGHNLSTTWNYETPPGQRPTLNSFLLWTARRRNIPAATLWVPIPFYLAGEGDPKAQLRVLDFFNRRLDLCADFSDLDEEVRQQNRMIAETRHATPEIDESIKKLEGGETLSDEESQRLAMEVSKSLAGKKG
jgi:proteasome assembly chaperone (PAC2) family protein